jgi:nicotinamide-nucleotide amidase
LVALLMWVDDSAQNGLLGAESTQAYACEKGPMSAMPEPLRSRAETVVKRALTHGVTLATVESCTAGLLAHLLSQAEGASTVLHGGFIVYTKENKSAGVGVPEELLAIHTAVSSDVARAMAAGGLARCPADLVAAITGVAGPEPDEDGNPVGLVHVAVAARHGRTKAAKHEFGKLPKQEICTAAIGAALDLLEEFLPAEAPRRGPPA